MRGDGLAPRGALRNSPGNESMSWIDHMGKSLRSLLKCNLPHTRETAAVSRAVRVEHLPAAQATARLGVVDLVQPSPKAVLGGLDQQRVSLVRHQRCQRNIPSLGRVLAPALADKMELLWQLIVLSSWFHPNTSEMVEDLRRIARRIRESTDSATATYSTSTEFF